MPKLPTIESSRDTQLLEKGGWDRGAIEEEKKGWVPKFKPASGSRPSHTRLIAIFLVFIITLVGIYTIFNRYFPQLLEKNQKQEETIKSKFVFPIDPASIKFPSDELKERFLANFREVEGAQTREEKYKLLEENFLMIKSFYSSTLSYEYRSHLEKYRDFMRGGFSEEVAKNSLVWEFSCVDKLCKEIVLSPEIETIKQKLLANKSIDPTVRDAIILNFEAASSEEVNAKKGAIYVALLSSLYSEFEKNKDTSTKDAYTELFRYIEKNYPDQRIPPQIKL